MLLTHARTRWYSALLVVVAAASAASAHSVSQTFSKAYYLTHALRDLSAAAPLYAPTGSRMRG